MPVNHTIQAAGRWIWGSPFTSRPKMNNNVNPPVPVIDQNGNKIEQWSFGIAYSKADFAQHIWPALEWEAKSIFSQGFPADFAWKFKDGDTALDQNGKPLRDKEGYAGNMVLSISTEASAPKVVQLIQGIYQQIAAGSGMKCGDYVRAALQIVAHGKKQGSPTSKPGLYLNPSLIEWIGVGKEIFNGPDAMATFGGQAFTALPAGALPPGSVPNMGGGQPGGFNPGQGGGFNPNAGQQQPGGFPGANGGNFTQPPQQPNGGGMNQNPSFNPANPAGGFASGAAQAPNNPAAFPSSPGGFPSGTAYPSNPGPQGNPAPDYAFTGGGQPQQGGFQPQGQPNGPQGFGGPQGFPGQR